MLKDLIEPQVLDPMSAQLTTGGEGRPAAITIGFLEPARRAVTKTLIARVRGLRERAPAARVVLLPYVSRLGVPRNAAVVAWRIRRWVNGQRVVFHCRTESAVEWAIALRSHFPCAAVVADIRGAWPEELLYARGFDGVDEADLEGRQAYEAALHRLRSALAASDAVLGVSESLLDWIAEQGVPRERMRCVPCSVRDITFKEADRVRMRSTLGLDGKLVFAYVGTTARYQHIEDGVAAFIRHVRAACPSAHLLCLTPEPDRMRDLLQSGGAPRDAVDVHSVPQSDVARYLCSADAGLLLRAPSRMNRVSMPVKLGEYLASGVPVIVSRMEGWVDEIVKEGAAGAALDWFGRPPAEQRAQAAAVCAMLLAGGAELRANAVRLCASRFVWSQHVQTVRALYREALDRAALRHKCGG
jgi:glycosyltransferase involved in cell wall biosynthesis